MSSPEHGSVNPLVHVRAERVELLVYGYIRRQESTLSLSAIVPDGIINLMIDLYPRLLLKFGAHNTTHFEVTDEGTVLRSINKQTCSGYMVYAQLDECNKDGISSGVHSWSLQWISDDQFVYHGHPECYQSVGVTQINPSKSALEKVSEHWQDEMDVTPQKEYSYYLGYNQWEHKEIITVVLNCDDWTVTYFKGTTGTEHFQQNTIQKGKYFFAVAACGAENRVRLRSVDVPSNLHCS